MSAQTKYFFYLLTLLLIFLSACNIFDIDGKKIELGIFDDSPNFGFPPAPDHPYIAELKVDSLPAFVGDSLTITCILHDSLNATNFHFEWQTPNYYHLPEVRVVGNKYETVAPDSAGTYYVHVSVDDDTTDSITPDKTFIGIIVQDKTE